MKLINIESSATVTPATLLAYCDTSATVLDLYTGSYWNYDTDSSTWYIDIGGASKLGIPEFNDYVLAKPAGAFTWIPKDGASGVVETLLPDLEINGVGGYVVAPALTIQAFDNANFIGNPIRYETVSTQLEVPDGGAAYYVAFNSINGVYITDDKLSMNMSNVIPLYTVSRIGTKIHSVGFDNYGLGLAQKNARAALLINPYNRSSEGGLILSEDGSRHIKITPARVFRGAMPISVLDYNSATAGHILTRAYHVAGVWTYDSTSSTYNVTNYDNGTNLVNLDAPNLDWKVIWVFRSIGDDTEVFYVDGPSAYADSASASAAKVPSIPPVMQWHCMLVGRIIVGINASSGTVQSAFDQQFSATSVTDHSNLSGLQGGVAGEYYHLSSSERTTALDKAHSSLTGKNSEADIKHVTNADLANIQKLPTIYSSLKDPTGWDDNNNITVTYDGTTRRVTLSRVSGNLKYWWNGGLVDLGSNSYSFTAAHANSVGTYYLYTTDGINFNWSTTSWNFDAVMVCVVDYVSSTQYMATRETHGLMPWTCHKDLHISSGTSRDSTTPTGGTVNGYTLGSTVEADRRPGATAVSLLDEDLVSVVDSLVDGGPYSHFNLTSQTTLDYVASQAEIIRMSGTRAQYQSPTTAEWTNLAENRFANVYLIAVPSTSDAISQGYRWMFLQAQATYSSLSAARLETVSGLNLADINTRFAEFLFCARITIKQSAVSNFSIEDVTPLYGSLQSQISVASSAGSTGPVIYDAVVNTEAELVTALQSATVQSIFVRSNTPITLQTNVTVGASKRIYGSYLTIGTCTITSSANAVYFYNTSIATTGTLTISNSAGGGLYFTKLTGDGTINSSVPSYYEKIDSTVVVNNQLFQTYWNDSTKIYDAIVNTNLELRQALESTTVFTVYVAKPATLGQPLTYGGPKRIYGEAVTYGTTTFTNGTYRIEYLNDSVTINGTGTHAMVNSGAGSVYFRKLIYGMGVPLISSTVASYYEECMESATTMLSTNMFQNFWNNSFDGSIYDAVVCTEADLRAALASATIQSIYVRLTKANANIVLGSGGDETINLTVSKRLYGQPFSIGRYSGTPQNTITMNLPTGVTIRIRNDRLDVKGRLTFTGLGKAYIKKAQGNASTCYVTGANADGSQLFVENLWFAGILVNGRVNIWDMPIRMMESQSLMNNQYLKYDAPSGEWRPVTITGPTDTPLLKAIDTIPVAASTAGVSIVRNSASTYRGHFTALAPNGDIKLDATTKVNFFCTQAPGSTPNYMVAIYESTSDVSVALSLVAYSTIAAFPNAIQWNTATLTNIVSGITGLSAAKKYFIGIIWASNGDANLLGIAGVTAINTTPITLSPAFDVDNITITSGAPPASFSSVGSVQTNRHHFRLTNAT